MHTRKYVYVYFEIVPSHSHAGGKCTLRTHLSSRASSYLDHDTAREPCFVRDLREDSRANEVTRPQVIQEKLPSEGFFFLLIRVVDVVKRSREL